MAAPTFLGLMGFYRRRRGPRRCPGVGRVPPTPPSGAAAGGHPWPLGGPQVAVRCGGVFLRIKIPRKFSPNSENISRSDFLKYKNNKNRELAMGILSIG